MAGKKINWGSRDQVAAVLFDDLGLPVMLKTPTGKPSTSEEAVVDLKGHHPIVNELLHYRELDKILGTYLSGWKQYIVGNRIYFSYKQTGTVTGRFSSRLHQIPTDGDIRSIIAIPEYDIARGEDEWQFVAADLSQAELRIAAEMSGDVSMISAYREGRDVHWDTVLFMVAAGHMDEYTDQAIKTALELHPLRMKSIRSLTWALEAMRAAGVEKCKKVWKGWKDARDCAKRINFGFLYGMYENTFIEKAKVDYDWMCTWKQAHAYRTGFFEQRIGLEPWHNRCKRIARIDGYVTNLFGRVRRLPAIQSSDKLARMEAERQAVNAPVQGTIGDWKAAAMVEIDETIDRDQFRLGGEHHDALLGRVRRGCEDDVLPRVRKIMERPKLLKTFKIRMQVPMVVDVNVGPWGKGKVYRDPI
jgi:DNA polymerase I